MFSSLIGAMLTAIDKFSDKRIKIPSESQFDDCNAVQYVAKRNWLILQARKDAKKRPSMLFVNLISLICFLAALCFIPLFLYGFLPSAPDINFLDFVLPDDVPRLLAHIIYIVCWIACWAYYIVCLVGCIACWLVYIALLIALMFFVALSFLLLIDGVPSWLDFKKKFRERKYFKRSMEARYYLHISQVLEIASNFDAYLLFDADSPDANPSGTEEITSFKNRVIGAKTINPTTSIHDMIKGAPSEKVVVFIYSQHGRTSHERAEEVRAKCNEDKGCENVRVYDLGPVCGDMRELEIVAHQLHYLQDGKCLKLP